MKKGTLLVSGKKTYQIVGLNGRDLVLVETSGNYDQVLIYGPEELWSLIEENRFELVDEGKKKNGGRK
ncbi:hypothetical protein [uncultured Acetobacterium sp.]|uniref:hypothetical protein n=1 Tax=uncultured Acetobacterium sp. TaxID=217139 RepID=UPI0025F1D49B|nr:hypothetical protein [uncultured Acetobacterium sp.]